MPQVRVCVIFCAKCNFITRVVNELKDLGENPRKLMAIQIVFYYLPFLLDDLVDYFVIFVTREHK